MEYNNVFVILEGETDFIWIVALLFFIRPTSAIVWIPLCIFHLILNKKCWFYLLIEQYLTIGYCMFTLFILHIIFNFFRGAMFALSVVIDSLIHGSLVFTSYNFIKFNFFEDIGSFYGSHPWHWYLSSGFPAILGIQFLPFILATIVVLRNKQSHTNELAMLGTITFIISVYRQVLIFKL